MRSAPAELEVALSPGRLVAGSVQFPRGCVGLVHTRALRSRHQLFPTNIDGDVAGEGAIIPWEEDLVLEDDPYLLLLQGWSDDDSFPHTVTWRFNVLSMEGVLISRESATLEARLRRRALGEEL